MSVECDNQCGVRKESLHCRIISHRSGKSRKTSYKDMEDNNKYLGILQNVSHGITYNNRCLVNGYSK